MDFRHTFPCSHEVNSLCDKGGDCLQLDLEGEWLMSDPEVARTAPMHGGDNRDSGLTAGCRFYLAGFSGGCICDLELVL